MKVLLITGGDSSEREVSLKSAENVEKALKQNGHQIYHYDLLKGHDPLRKLANSYDVLFPVLHGEEGEGGILHKYLVGLGKPIVGTRNYRGLERGWYKLPFKQFCDTEGIKTSPWKIIKKKQDVLDFGFPSVLKASNGGSSREVVILKNEFDLESDDAKNLLKNGKELYAEKFQEGKEVTVGILDDEPLPIIEIVPPQGSWFSFENKYTSGTKEIPFAPSINKDLQEEIQATTLKIHKELNLGSISRTDFIVVGEEFYALEVNTIPGLTSGSLMPKMAEAAGMSFNEFVEKLLKSAT
jgi:D-alanine-D-alanine ligase